MLNDKFYQKVEMHSSVFFMDKYSVLISTIGSSSLLKRPVRHVADLVFQTGISVENLSRLRIIPNHQHVVTLTRTLEKLSYFYSF